MAKVKVADWDLTASNNTDINSIGLSEGVTKVPAFNNIVREMMAEIAAQFQDDQFYVANVDDPTKKVALDLSGLTTATTRTYVAPDKNGTVALTSDILVPKGHIYGLTTSNNASDANNDIDIAAGECASDATTPVLLVLASSITKRLDASWAVGTNQGGLDTGSKANSTWYYIWVIGRSDTGVVDALFSASATSPTMPTNYDQKQVIAAVLTNSSGNIIAYKQYGDRFLWTTPIVDVPSPTTIGTSASTFTMSVPNLQVVALLSARVSIASAVAVVYVSGPGQADVVPSSSDYFTLGTDNLSGGSNSFAPVEIDTNTQQIRARSTQASTTFYCATRGWVFRRAA